MLIKLISWASTGFSDSKRFSFLFLHFPVFHLFSVIAIDSHQITFLFIIFNPSFFRFWQRRPFSNLSKFTAKQDQKIYFSNINIIFLRAPLQKSPKIQIFRACFIKSIANDHVKSFLSQLLGKANINISSIKHLWLASQIFIAWKLTLENCEINSKFVRLMWATIDVLPC